MRMWLSEKPVLHPQECPGDYLFKGVVTVVTRAFQETFGDETSALCFASLYEILENRDRPDWIQVFTFKGIKYWCISNFREGDKPSDYEGVEKLYITFLLPEDY